MKSYYAYIVLFVSGAVVLILEILGSRILAPFYGSTIFVWSSLISTALGFLSVGYYLGGKLADKYPSNILFYFILSLAGLTTATTYSFKPYILIFSDNFGLQYGPLVASIIFFAIPFCFYGMVSPFTIRILSTSKKNAGSVSGKVMGISTAGSLVGSLLTGFFLVSILTIPQIVYGVSAIMILLAVLGATFDKGVRKKYKSLIHPIFIILFSLFATYVVQTSLKLPKMTRATHGIYETETIYKETSYYGTYEFVGVPNTKKGVHCLLIDGSNQGCVLPKHLDSAYNTGSPYAGVAFIMESLSPESDVLILGAGAGEYLRYWAREDINYTVVDINPSTPQILELAEVDTNKYNIVIDDARSYLRNTDKQYDLIWNDLFGNANPVTNLVTIESLELSKAKLKTKGLYVTNIFGKTNGQDILVNSVFSTLSEVFLHVVAAPKDIDTFFNYTVAVASNNNLDPNKLSKDYYQRREIENDVWGPQNYYFFKPEFSGIILTDNYNPADLLWAQNIAKYETVQGYRSKFKRLTYEDFK